MVHVAHNWTLEVDRGPDWLFVRPHSPPPGTWNGFDPPDLADEIWGLVEQAFTRRLVLELDQVTLLDSDLIGQLLRVYQRIMAQSGCLRICGLSDPNRALLEASRLADILPCYENRSDAVMAGRPTQPR